ncbi:hypothetical protein MAXJ12_16978 [Mesorhizobium alhagi CCNWXJ12-2]|uniref:Uncharacterized protein n=1 Tax=Mesorhizobium alhagi CCNWXJ12-2 TaxID=1107882 RepID=H0HTA4_9HYPH|nr:hypothetical protein MAXJ12_16978 [Mesorhizobium alhagi CCNWXJ12-2]
MAKPAAMPNICGTVRQNPKFTPDASSMKLFGPGVTEVTKAKTSRARKASGDMNLFIHRSAILTY